MEEGTDALSTAGEAVEPLELDPIELSEEDIADDPRHPGHDAGGHRALRARRRAPRRLPGRGARAGSSRCASAAACAASPRSSSTAAPASPPTAWACGRCRRARILEIGRRMAAFRGISHCYQRPTYADWPYSVFTMAHGRSKEECDAILDSIAEATGITERATLYSCTEFKKVRMLYFTDDFRRWERGARPDRLADRHPLGGALPPRAARPAGRRELARARDALDRARPDLHRPRRGRGDHRRRRQHLRRLRLLVGPADPRPRSSGGAGGGRARRRRAARRSARRPPARSSSPSWSRSGCRRVDMLRMTSSGTEASMSAIRARARRHRPRQAAQVRRRLPRPRRRPARRGRLRPRHAGHPRLARRARGRDGRDRGRPLERPRRRRAPRSPSTSFAAVLAEPYPANMGLVPPATGFLELLRELAPSTARCSSSTR